jgi:hypothetical protein
VRAERVPQDVHAGRHIRTVRRIPDWLDWISMPRRLSDLPQIRWMRTAVRMTTSILRREWRRDRGASEAGEE